MSLTVTCAVAFLFRISDFAIFRACLRFAGFSFRIFFPSPTDVSNAIGEYPAVFLAALMASIDAVPPARWDEAEDIDYDPIASSLDG